MTRPEGCAILCRCHGNCGGYDITLWSKELLRAIACPNVCQNVMTQSSKSSGSSSSSSSSSSSGRGVIIDECEMSVACGGFGKDSDCVVGRVVRRFE